MQAHRWGGPLSIRHHHLPSVEYSKPARERDKKQEQCCGQKQRRSGQRNWDQRSRKRERSTWQLGDEQDRLCLQPLMFYFCSWQDNLLIILSEVAICTTKLLQNTKLKIKFTGFSIVHLQSSHQLAEHLSSFFFCLVSVQCKKLSPSKFTHEP